MSATKLRQVELYNEATDAVMICWVENDPRIQFGTRLTLKAIPETVWKVTHVYNMKIDSDSIPRGWKVGGL